MQKALVLLAKIYLLTNDWGNAIGAAELALEINRKNITAIQIKADSLFNICQFERALVLEGLAEGSCFGMHSCQVQLIWPLFGEPGEPGFSPPAIVSTHPCKVSGLLPSTFNIVGRHRSWCSPEWCLVG